MKQSTQQKNHLSKVHKNRTFGILHHRLIFMKKAIGIDLGTSHSSAAHVDRGFPEMIQISEEGYSIPSVVSLDQKSSFDSQSNIVPIRHSKRMIGRNLESDLQTQGYQQIFTYDIAESGTQNILNQIKEQAYTLEDISSEILKQVKQGAEHKLKTKIDAVVLTVPAYFNELQRKSIRKAGELAGLEVLRVINEPTAAALAYGFQQDMNARIAVYDFGGGTFDLSMIDIQGSVFEVIATGGNPMLGGIDIDDCIVHWIFAQFQKRTGIDISYRVDIYDQLRQLAESAKITLSKEESTNISLHGIINLPETSTSVPIELSRVQLEGLVDHLVQQTIDCFDRLLGETATVKEELDTIILVGGQSKMPLVQQKLQHWFGREIDFSIHPDEAVALGGALMAEAIIQQKKNNTIFSLMDVLPLQIAIQRENGDIEILFEKHTPLPNKKRIVLQTTKKRQRTLRFSLFQKGVSPNISQYDKIGDYYIKNLWNDHLPSGPNTQQDYVHIELNFSLADDGELSISGRNIQTNTVVTIDIQGIGTYATFETNTPLPVIQSTIPDNQISPDNKSKDLFSGHSDMAISSPLKDATESSVIQDTKRDVPSIDLSMDEQLPFFKVRDSELITPNGDDSQISPDTSVTNLESILADLPEFESYSAEQDMPEFHTDPIANDVIEKPKDHVSSQSLWNSFSEESSPSVPSSKSVENTEDTSSSNQRNLWLQKEPQQVLLEQQIVQNEKSQPLWGENHNTPLVKEEHLKPAELNIAKSWLDKNQQPVESDDSFAHIMENEPQFTQPAFITQDVVENNSNPEKESILLADDSVPQRNQEQMKEAHTLFPLPEQPTSIDALDDLDLSGTLPETSSTSNNPHEDFQIPEFLEFGSEEANTSQPDVFENSMVSEADVSPLLSKEISSHIDEQTKDMFQIPTSELPIENENDHFSIFDVSTFDTEINQNKPNPKESKPINETMPPPSLFPFEGSFSDEDIQVSSEQRSLQQSNASAPFFSTPEIQKENPAPTLFPQQDPFEFLDSNAAPRLEDDSQQDDDPFSSLLEDSNTNNSLSTQNDPFESSSNMFPKDIFETPVTSSSHTQSPFDVPKTSTNSEWTTWSTHSSDPVTEEISFPLGGMGESVDMTNEDMFDNNVEHDNDSFGMFPENPIHSLQESATNPSSTQTSSNNIPPKHIEDQDWFAPTTSETQVTPPQELGNITEELQLNKKPNFAQKIWSWFSSLF